MTTITRLREKLAACEKLIEAENAARPKSPRKGVKPPPPSVEAQRLAAELRNASAELAEAIPPARDEYDRLVSAKKEEFAEAIKKAMLPFFGGSLDLLARRQQIQRASEKGQHRLFYRFGEFLLFCRDQPVVLVTGRRNSLSQLG